MLNVFDRLVKSTLGGGIPMTIFILAIVAGVAGAQDRMGLYLDATLIANLWFPAVAGWL